MRVPNRDLECIGYRLNLLGVRVHRTYCQLVAKDGEDWVPVGIPKPLPVFVTTDPFAAGSDPLLLTAYQYEKEQPGSDLIDVLAQRKNFDTALNEHSNADGHATGR